MLRPGGEYLAIRSMWGRGLPCLGLQRIWGAGRGEMGSKGWEQAGALLCSLLRTPGEGAAPGSGTAGSSSPGLYKGII